MRERWTRSRTTAPLGSADAAAPVSAGSAAQARDPDRAADAAALAADAAAPGRTDPRPDLLDLLFGDEAVAEPPLPDLPPAAPARPDAGDPFASPPSGLDPFAPTGPALAGDGAAIEARAPRPSTSAPGGAFEHHRSLAAGERAPGPDDETRRISRAPDACARPRAVAARLARRKGVLAAVVLAAVGAVPVELVAAGSGAAVEPAFARELAAADERLAAGQIAIPDGDAALDHLEAARSLLPEDVRLTSRGRTLADTLEALGDHALGRGDLQEARAHFRSALRADPFRPGAQAKLETIDRIAPLHPGARR